MANAGTIAALAGRGDVVLQDRLNHASLLDGARLSGAKLQRYAHSDLDALENNLTAQEATRKTDRPDGVFSMDVISRRSRKSPVARNATTRG